MKREMDLSIIIPIYNKEKYIERCVESIEDVYEIEYEIILVDDGSNDKSFEICTCLEQKNRKIIVYKQENAGVSVARNSGLKLARGENIMFVDCDDCLCKGAMKTIENALQFNPKADIYCFDFYLIGKNDKKYATREYLKGRFGQVDFQEMLMSIKSNAVWGNIYKKKNMELNSISFKQGILLGEDMIFNLEYQKTIENGVYYRNPIYMYYEDNTGSAMNTQKIKYVYDFMILFDYIYEFYDLYTELINQTQIYYLDNIFKNIFIAPYADDESETILKQFESSQLYNFIIKKKEINTILEEIKRFSIEKKIYRCAIIRKLIKCIYKCK